MRTFWRVLNDRDHPDHGIVVLVFMYGTALFVVAPALLAFALIF